MAHRSPRQCWCVFPPLPRCAEPHPARPFRLDVDHDPSKAARDARKERVAKNERQHKQNVARATQSTGPSTGPSTAPVPNSIRKKEIDRTLAVTRASTASMGKFDRKLEGEKKLKGLKRKVCPRFASGWLDRC